MAEISLQPIRLDDEQLPLDQQISRVIRERGSYAKLDENVLQSAISVESNNTLEDSDDRMDIDGTNTIRFEEMRSDQSAVGESCPDEQVHYTDLRQNLAAKIATAVNEAALNLDFVSLLVSASRPQSGNSSLSPMLRSQTPSGSLNAETVQSAAPCIPPTASYGWKVRKYTESSTKLSDAAFRLQAEASMEAKFWKDILNATSQGEVINRKLQIKYGYRDSGSRFGERGVGTIERSPNGDAEFRSSNIHAPCNTGLGKLVQVSVFADQHVDTDMLNGLGSSAATPEPEKFLGKSVVPYMFSLESLAPLLRAIRLERNNLFELELMQQLIHEARWELASYKVKLFGEKIICELFGGRIEIQLVDYDTRIVHNADGSNHVDEINDLGGTSVDIKDWNPAHAINYCLHLLLVQQFHNHFEAMHSIPTPLTSKSKLNSTTGTQAILKPVLSKLQHSILISRIFNLIKVIFPQARVTSKTSDEFLMPSCDIIIENNDKTAELEVGPPISDTSKPMLMASFSNKKTGISDLSELEIWLKWALGS